MPNVHRATMICLLSLAVLCILGSWSLLPKSQSTAAAFIAAFVAGCLSMQALGIYIHWSNQPDQS